MEKENHFEKPVGSVRSYLFGFLFSLILTLSAYILVVSHMNSGHTLFSHDILLIGIVVLAFVQLVVQLVFFLHLGHEKGPRWNLAFFASTISIIFIIVIGSIWIMSNLNYNMTPQMMSDYMIEKEGIHK